MVFNSLSFLVFFSLVTALYFAVGHRFRWPLLLAARALFYSAFIPAYLLVLAGSILAVWGSAILVAGAAGHRRVLLFKATLVVAAAPLVFFK